MSSKFLKSKLLTFALAAAMLFGVIGFAGAGVANAEAVGRSAFLERYRKCGYADGRQTGFIERCRCK